MGPYVAISPYLFPFYTKGVSYLLKSAVSSTIFYKDDVGKICLLEGSCTSMKRDLNKKSTLRKLMLLHPSASLR